MSKMYLYRDALPSLPIPTLQSTKESLLEWIAPILTKSEYETSKLVIEDFFQAGGAGEKLQRKLEAWDNELEGSWLKPLWDELYFTNRATLPISSNFNVLLESIGKEIDLAATTAKIGVFAAMYYHKIIDEDIVPEMIRDRPLDMSQYPNLFRSVRIPKQARDDFYIAPYTKKNNFIILLYRNYVLKVYITNEQGVLYDSQAITQQIATAIASIKEPAKNATIFTAAGREKAAEVYGLLQKSATNNRLLTDIAEGLLIVSIDESSTTALEALQSLTIGAENKYFDKTLQIVITKQGEVGFNMEHAAIDETTVAPFIISLSKALRADTNYPGEKKAVPEVSVNSFELTAELTDILQSIAETYQKEQANIATSFEKFTGFGAERIKQMKISPDAFFHMALQLAYYRTYGKFDSVYEPIAVRGFKEGRTECARATSLEKSALVTAIETDLATKPAIYDLMVKASAAHAHRLGQAQRGYGVERHLFGLEQMYHRYHAELGIESLPALFTDVGYKKLCHDALSTSGMIYEDALTRMFAPMVSDGHGVAYIMAAEYLSIGVSSFSEYADKGKKLQTEITKALNELAEIALSVVEESKITQ